MPIWKKKRFISKLVADHLHPPKHGGSLVVETGFPTSLIDLFHKNQDRLKISSKKKRFDPIPDPIPPPIPTPTCPPPSSTTLARPSISSPLFTPICPNSGLGAPSVCVLASERCSPRELGNEIAENQESGGVADGEGRGGGEVVAANGVFVAILKVFMVVVLALGTKKFVVGITLSAFLLFFIEYAGKHLCWLVKPFVDAQKSLVDRGLCFFVGIKRGKLIFREDRSLKAGIDREGVITPVVSDGLGLVEGHKIDDPFQEIQVVQPNSDLGRSRLIEGGHRMKDPFQEIQIEQPCADLILPSGEILSVKYEFDLCSGEEKWVRKEISKKKEVMEKEEPCNSDVVDLKSQKSRRGKIGSKIKKLVPKKLRGSKKKRTEMKNEVVMDEAKEHLEEFGERRGLDYDDKSSSFSCGGNEYDDQSSPLSSGRVDAITAICSSSELSQADMEDSVVVNDVGTTMERAKAEKNSGRSLGYLILVVIVLVGLVWGRVLALALALSWYLLLKSAGPLLRKFTKGSPKEVSITS